MDTTLRIGDSMPPRIRNLPHVAVEAVPLLLGRHRLEQGIGRIDIGPLADLLSNPALSHVYIDLSWSETAKYVIATPETVEATAAAINRHPDRFLFGTDEVAPTDQARYLAVYDTYTPLFARLTPDASEMVRKKNYERLFDEARRRVRAWEQIHLKETLQ